MASRCVSSLLFGVLSLAQNESYGHQPRAPGTLWSYARPGIPVELLRLLWKCMLIAVVCLQAAIARV